MPIVLHMESMLHCPMFFAKGGAGGVELAKEVVALAESGKADFAPIYASELTLKEKIATVAREIYGAGDVVYAKEAETALKDFESLGYGNLPICMAKTQYSFSDDPTLLGRPSGFTMTIKKLQDLCRRRLCSRADR